MCEKVREHLKGMLEAGAIRESKSPFASNVVFIRQKDRSLRFWFDLRKLNKRTIERMPMFSFVLMKQVIPL